jgi:hypothetical protein
MVDNMSGRGGSKVDRTDDAGVSDMASGDGPIGTNGAARVDEEPAAKKRRWGGSRSVGSKMSCSNKDVTTRALAAGIVALGATFFALGAGYVSTPTGAEAAKGVVNVVGSVVIAALAAWADGSYTGRPTRVRTERRSTTSSSSGCYSSVSSYFCWSSIRGCTQYPFGPSTRRSSVPDGPSGWDRHHAARLQRIEIVGRWNGASAALSRYSISS